MTVPKTQGHNKTRNNLPWYQVPVLWVCVGVFLLTLLACAHLIILSLEKAPVLPTENHRGNTFLPAAATNQTNVNLENRTAIITEMLNEQGP